MYNFQRRSFVLVDEEKEELEGDVVDETDQVGLRYSTIDPPTI